MQRRIFVAINLTEKIKNKLACYQDEIEELFLSQQSESSGTGPIRWTKKENLHITLEFLGHLADEELIELCQKTKKIASGKEFFNIRLNKICYGPPDKKQNRTPRSMSPSNSFLRSSGFLKENRTPRMVWVTGEKIKEFNLVPHITLGRIRAWEFKRLEPEERPEINREIDLDFEVKSIEIMESQLKRSGMEYITLESFPLSE